MKYLIGAKGTPSGFRLALVLLLLIPVIDALNGIMILDYGISGVGLLYHICLLGYLAVFVYCSESTRIEEIDLLFVALITTIIVSASINEIIIGGFKTESVERVAKILATALFVIMFIKMGKKSKTIAVALNRTLIIVCFLTLVITLIADVFGFAHAMYRSTGTGRIGFFIGPNESVVVFLIIGCVCLLKYDEDYKKRYLLGAVGAILCLMFAQSRSAYLFVAIIAIGCIAIIVKKIASNSAIGHLSIIAIGLILFASIIAIGLILHSNIDDFITRQAAQLKGHSNLSLDYLTSGRSLNIDTLLSPIFDRSPAIILFQILFGQGLTFGYLETFEMNLLDVFQYGGLISAGIATVSVVMLFVNIKQRRFGSAGCACFLLVIAYAFFAGHVWTGGVSGLYFALFSAFLLSIGESTEFAQESQKSLSSVKTNRATHKLLY